jgi:hypothetical protein
MTLPGRAARIFRKTACSANVEKAFLKTQSELSAAIAPKVEREQIRSWIPLKRGTDGTV